MKTIDEALNEYLNKGFGSMNKNDFEVWIFNQLLQSQLKDKDNYATSIYLKIPESKVKRLRYEASLKYSSINESNFHQTISSLLSKAKFKKDGQCIQFVVEDVAVRKYLDSLLKRDGRFSDSSFNSEIVSIDINDLEYILCSTPTGNYQVEKIVSAAKKNSNKADISFKSLLKTFAQSAAKEAGEKIVDLSFAGIASYFKLIIT